jgi:hypothetical protein
MTGMLTFSRNRSTSVVQTDEHTMTSICRLQDTLTDAMVEISVRLPDLEILTVHGDVRQTFKEGCLDVNQALQGVIGVRIGPGMLKIIKGLVGEATDCKQLAFMVEECCHGVILSFTKDVLEKAPRDEAGAREFYADQVRENIRLYNRCAAFAPGSSLVEGIEPPES